MFRWQNDQTSLKLSKKKTNKLVLSRLLQSSKKLSRQDSFLEKKGRLWCAHNHQKTNICKTHVIQQQFLHDPCFMKDHLSPLREIVSMTQLTSIPCNMYLSINE